MYNKRGSQTRGLQRSVRKQPCYHLLQSCLLKAPSAAGSTVQKGMWVAVSPYAIHNDSRVWGSDVEQFLPERWLTEDPAALKKAKKGFFAFGHGPRVCPGSRFALLEMKLTLIRIFQNFTLELGPKQVPCKSCNASSCHYLCRADF